MTVAEFLKKLKSKNTALEFEFGTLRKQEIELQSGTLRKQALEEDSPSLSLCLRLGNSVSDFSSNKCYD